MASNSYEHLEPYDPNAALRNQIVRTRADLGDTLQELASRADVKARAREAVADAKVRAKQAVRSRVMHLGRRSKGAASSGATRMTDLGRRSKDAASSGGDSARITVIRAGGPVTIVAGAGLGVLAGYGVFKLMQKRKYGHLHPRGMR